MERLKARHLEFERLAIASSFINAKDRSEDEKQAISLLLADKEIPKDLEQRLLDTREERLKQIKKNKAELHEKIANMKFD